MEIRLDVSDPVQRVIRDTLNNRQFSSDELLNGSDEKEDLVTLDIGLPVGGVKLRSVTIEGFGPHDGPNVITLDGSTMILEGRNGTGKSSIIYAINWCVTGRTGNMDPWSEEEGSLDLVNWNIDDERTMSVSVELYLGNRCLTITRRIEGGVISSVIIDENGKEMGPSSLMIVQSILPFILYQGESSMFLSLDGPRSGRGILHDMMFSSVGGNDLRNSIARIRGHKENLMSRLNDARTRSEKLEGRMEEIEKQRGRIENDLLALREDISVLSRKKESSRRSYLELINGRLQDGKDPGKEEKRRTMAATRAGRLEERLSSAFDLSAVELLRSQATRALTRAMKRSREEDEKRMMSGAIDAQLHIIEQVLDRERCICGTPIGTSGMGKERLKHLKERLDERKEIECVWDPGSIWSSDQFLWQVRSLLSREGLEGEKMLEMLDDLSESRSAMITSAGKDVVDDRSEIINAVREMERTRILYQEKKRRAERLEEEQKDLESEMSDLQDRLLKVFGNRRGREGLAETAIILDGSIEWIEGEIRKRVDDLREDIEGRATGILKEITGRTDLGISIHPEKMRIGRIQKTDDGHRIVPITRLSAGEREAVALALVLALSEPLNTGLILDSPFMNMESGSIVRSVRHIIQRGGNVMITVPEATIPESSLEELEAVGSGFRRFELARGEKGSVIKEVGN